MEFWLVYPVKISLTTSMIPRLVIFHKVVYRLQDAEAGYKVLWLQFFGRYHVKSYHGAETLPHP